MNKNIKNGYRIGMVSMKDLNSGKFTRIKLSKNQYKLEDALDIINKVKFPCILCDHIGTPVSL